MATDRYLNWLLNDTYGRIMGDCIAQDMNEFYINKADWKTYDKYQYISGRSSRKAMKREVLAENQDLEAVLRKSENVED